MKKKNYVISKYNIVSEKIKKKTILVFLSDMHECLTDINGMVDDIENIDPDVVLIGGDMIIARDIRFEHYHWCDQILEFSKIIAKKYPTYAIDGNHEAKVMSTVLWDGNTTKRCYDYLWDKLNAAGVVNLNDNRIEVNGLDIFGLQLELNYYRKVDNESKKLITLPDLLEKIGRCDNTRFTILLAHTPQFFATYCKWGADLTLAGHYHGGVIKIGKQGLLGPANEIFPRYCGGMYQKKDSNGFLHQMIVSNGIGEHTTHLRINNPREIVVVELRPKDT